MTPIFVTGAASALALAASALLLAMERDARGRPWGFLPLAVLAPLAVVAARVPHAPPSWAPLAAVLAIALLARDRDDVLHSECALKLLWVMASAFALSWAGQMLLVVVTGSARPAEQWAALGVGLDPPLLWRMAVPLGLLAGIVLLGGAPFHFWSADLLQGSRAWLAPLGIVALQASGACWVARALDSIGMYPEAAALASGTLAIAAGTALVVGGTTLLWQRRPERRIGTLASLHGGLALALLAATHANRAVSLELEPALARWAAHLVLAIGGAATLSRLLPVSLTAPAAPAALFRRHPWSGAAGLFALASLCGVPGTPGAGVWMMVARALVQSGSVTMLLALAFAWIASFACAAGQVREAFGIPQPDLVPGNAVPKPVRGALWIAAFGLAVLGGLLLRGRI